MNQAKAIEVEADARRNGLKSVAQSLELKQGRNAASLAIAEQYVKSFGQRKCPLSRYLVGFPLIPVAKSTNTLIVPANASDPNSMVAQALTIFQKLSSHQNFESHPTSSNPGKPE